MNELEITKQKKQIKNKQYQYKRKLEELHKQELKLKLKNYYVIFAYAKSVFVDPCCALQYFYYCNPRIVPNDSLFNKKNPDNIEYFEACPMDKENLESSLGDKQSSEFDHETKMLFTKKGVDKFIKHSPSLMKPILSKSVMNASDLLDDDNNNYSLDDEYTD